MFILLDISAKWGVSFYHWLLSQDHKEGCSDISPPSGHTLSNLQQLAAIPEQNNRGLIKILELIWNDSTLFFLETWQKGGGVLGAPHHNDGLKIIWG